MSIKAKLNTLNMNLKYLFLPLCLALTIQFSNSQTIIRVDRSSTAGNPDGSTWALAYPGLTQALTLAHNTVGPVQIWVANGTYYPTNTTNRNIAFTISRANLTVAGGFAGTETSFSQRNPILNPTTLSGNIGSTSTNTDNSFKVVWVNNAAVNTSTHLMGLQISDGYTTTFGGGVFVSAGEISMTDCIFYNNRAQLGGGAYFVGPALAVMDQNIVSRCIFRDNYASLYGGGVSLVGASVKFNSCLFYNNEGVQGGGGLHVGSSITDIFNCTFTKNTTSTLTGIQYMRGSAIFFDGTLSNNAIHKITNSIIVGNTPFNNLQIARPTNWGTYNNNLFEGTGFGTNVLTFNPALPLFADEANNNYTINKFCSQAFNQGITIAGLPNLDLDGNQRISNGKIDLGAYEYNFNEISSITSGITCTGFNTGVITIPFAGSGSVYYLDQTPLNGWGSISTTRQFPNLAPGKYYTGIRQSGCTNITLLDSATILNIPVLSFSGIVTQISCNGASNAEVRVTSILGGFGASPKGVRVNASSNFFVPNTFTGIGVGVTTVTVSQLTCARNYFYNITQPSALSTGLSGWTDVACNGQNNGKVIFIPSGGAAPYSYSVSGISANASTIAGGYLEIGGLTPGTKRLNMRDANGCTVNSGNFEITQPSPLLSSVLSKKNISCNNLTDGMLVMTATGGSNSDYIFTVINNPAIARNLNSLLGMSAGIYSVRVADFNNCGHTLTGITITMPSALVASRLVTHNLCSGLNQAAITMSGTGGTAPYLYNMDGGTYQSSRAFTGLFQGSYILRVKDANNCEAVTSANLVDPLAFGISELGIAPTCNENTDGKLLVTLTGGTGIKSTTINGAWFSGNFTATGLSGGQQYQLRIQDQNGCLDFYNTQVPEKAAITLTGLVSKATCTIANDWSVTLNALGGNGGFNYKFDFGNYSTANSISNLSPSTILGFAQDNKGCVATVTSVVSQSSNPLTASLASKSDILCFGANTGSISLNVSGGIIPYIYSVNNGAYGNVSSLSNLNAGTKQVLVKDQSNCIVTVSGISLTEPATGISATTSIESGNAIRVTASGGTGSLSYSINNGAAQSTNLFSNLTTSGIYTIRVTDANGCVSTVQQNLIVTSLLSDSESVSDLVEIYPNPSLGQFYFKSKSNGILNIYDANGSLISEVAIKQPTQTITLEKSGIYLLRFVTANSIYSTKLAINR